MLRLIGIALGLLFVSLIATGTARADSCQFNQDDHVDVTVGNGWKPGVVLKVDDPDSCTYTVRALKMPGDASYDPYAGSYFEEYLRPNTIAFPYDNPGGCPYAVNDVIDEKGDGGQWHRAAVQTVDVQMCDMTIAPINAANEVDTDNVHAVSFGDIRDTTLAAPSTQEAATAKAAEMCQGGDTADNTKGSDPQSLMRHGVAADLDKKTGKTEHVTFEQVQAGRTSTIGDNFTVDHPDAVVGDVQMPYRITASICTDGEAQATPLRFSFEYICYANAFGEGICDATSARQLN